MVATPRLAEDDAFISKDAEAQINHAGVHCDATAAALANGRTQSFLREHLK